MNNNFIKRLFSVAFCGALMANSQAQVTLNVDAGQRGPAIGDRHYGLFFEEINHAGDGGLYAELIQNRSFEDNASAPDSWETVGNASVSLTTADLLNEAQGHALQVEMAFAGDGVRNEGYWGINVVNGRTYKLTFWAKSTSSYKGTLTAALQTKDKASLGSTDIAVDLTTEWTKLTAEITATGDATDGWFSLTGSDAGVICLDVVSLFPPTYKNRDNGCREDLAKMLEVMKPAFVRFPGGCYVEGYSDGTNNNRFEWKKTIGPIEERSGHRNQNWGYNVTDGFGFHEMLQLTEDLGAEPLFVVNMGMGHGWVEDYGNIDEYIQEALDAIEYCNGDVTTTWGALRAKNGHPEPFNLRLMEIGNENYNYTSTSNSDQSDHYAERYEQFRKAIKAKYPEVMLIGNVEAWSTDTPSWRNAYPVDAVDEHYYRNPSWFINQYNKYDNYSRTSHKVYVGEYAVTSDFGTNGHLNAAIGEAVYMLGMENNSDVCIMNSYAPIFVNENNYNWKPDMIRFNSYTSFGTPSYYVQQLFPNNVGKQNVKWTEENNSSLTSGKLGLSTWSTKATFDNMKVTDASGNVIFSDDFSTTKSEWTSNGGSWTVADGVLTQSDAAMQGKLYVCNVDPGESYTYEVEATKTKGAEGFLIAFNYQDSKNYCWWNIGGWNNAQHGVEMCSNGTKTTLVSATGSLNTNQTYKIKIVVNGSNVKCYLDDALIHDFSLPVSRKVYVSSNIDDEAGKLYMKIVNPGSTAQTANINLSHASVTGGSAVVLTSTNGTDENDLANPTNVSPKETTLNVSGKAFTYEAPAYSVNILRLDVTDVEIVPEEQATLPEPLVQYSFDGGQVADDSNAYPASLQGGAAVVTMSDGNKALYTGANADNGYMDLGTDMAKQTLAKLTGDYTISVDLALPSIGQLNNFCWAYAIANGTSQYIGLVNQTANVDWYYTIKNTDAVTASTTNSSSSLSYGAWHNVTYVQSGATGRIYIDGYLTGEQGNVQSPSEMAAAVTAAYLGRSPFASDALLSEAYIDNFRIYNSALGEVEVKALYAQQKDRSVQSPEATGEADKEEVAVLMKKFNYLHTTTDLPAETEMGTAVAWSFAATDAASNYVTFADGALKVNSLPQGSEPVNVGTLTATLGENGSVGTVTKAVMLAPDDNRYGYLYCFMNSNDETTNYALGTKESKGHEYNVLLGGDEIFDTYKIAQIEHGTRDAYITRGEDGDGYLITTTDMKQHSSGVWRNKGLNLVRSKDLIHWEGTTFNFTKGKSIFSDPTATTDGYKTDAEYANINRVWAPQVIWDKDANGGEGAYLVYYSLLSSNTGDTYDRIFYSYTNRDFTTMTQPRVFFDPGISVIDADIIYNPYDSLYHMYYKREGATGTERGIYEATTERLVGGTWTDVLHVTNEGSEQVEGSSTIRRINEDAYNLYYMRYSGGNAYKYCETDYLCANPSGSAALSGTGAFQHGSFMTVTEDEYNVLQAWSDVKTYLPTVKTMKESTGTMVFDAAIAQAEEALELTTIAELAEALPAAYKALKSASDNYIDEMCNAVTDDSPVDLTSLLVNPDFSDGSTGWTGTSFTAASSGVAEFWNKTFDTYQILKNMPAGTYRLTASGFYRYGDKASAYTAHTNGTEQLLAVMYLNDQKQAFMSLFDASAPYTYSPYTYPDNVSTANSAFNTKKAYADNAVVYSLPVKGDLKVGIAKEIGYTNDWNCFDNFKLYYINKATGITDVTATAATAVDVYTISGVKLRSAVRPADALKGLSKGLYIVGSRKVAVH